MESVKKETMETDQEEKKQSEETKKEFTEMYLCMVGLQ
jgi:hypothetical protein